jgi:hypothetical protein
MYPPTPSLPTRPPPDNDSPETRKPYPAWCFSLGLVFLIIGLFLPAAFDSVVDLAVWKQLRLDHDKVEGYETWALPNNNSNSNIHREDAVLLKFYVFHVINAKQVIQHGDPPQLVEKGPYVYQLEMRHVDVKWVKDPGVLTDHSEYHDDADTKPHSAEIHYKTWQIVQHVTTGQYAGLSDTDIVTMPNFPYHILSQAVNVAFPISTSSSNNPIGKKKNPNHNLGQEIIDSIYPPNLYPPEKRIFTTRTVREQLFGYTPAFPPSEKHGGKQHPFIASISHKLLDGTTYPGFVQNISTLEEVRRLVREDALSTVRSTNREYVWWQGGQEMKRCGTCQETIWRTPEASRPSGGDSKFFARNRKKRVFMPPLWKSIDLIETPYGTVTAKRDGIECKRYVMASHTFSNGTNYPPNLDYYSDHLPDGFHNLTGLIELPIYVSKPWLLDASLKTVEERFKWGDPMKYVTNKKTSTSTTTPSTSQQQVNDRDLYDTIFDIHEETGIAVGVKERFQYNLEFTSNTNDPMPLQHGLIPIFWFETWERMTNKHRHLFERCDRLTDIAHSFKYIGIVCGVFCAVVSMVIGTLRGERDAIKKQREAHSFIAVPPGKTGIALLWSSPSVRWGWITTPMVIFSMNSAIEALSLRKDHFRIGMWKGVEPGSTTVAVQLFLTSLLVGIFVTITAVSITRASYSRGELPHVEQKPIWWGNDHHVEERDDDGGGDDLLALDDSVDSGGLSAPFLQQHHHQQQHNDITSLRLKCNSNINEYVHQCSRVRRYVLPCRYTSNACGMGLLIGLFAVVVWGIPCIFILWISMCGPWRHDCEYPGLPFILLKALFAAVEACVIFPFACHRVLEDKIG